MPIHWIFVALFVMIALIYDFVPAKGQNAPVKCRVSWRTMSPRRWLILFWIVVGIVAATYNALAGFPVKGSPMVTAVFLWIFVLLALGEASQNQS